uniref:hypothetical protein n=1 Tax=Bathymodiolus platifrons methanotrophic gill symbiont TaxID=113268 RepID=UPI000B41742B|nr:hypothetical protein [Bathymodiolus platifrons methanotrophic gill symbiont]
MLRSQHRVYDGSGEVARTQDVWGAEGISGRVKFLPLAWAGMPKTSFRKNSDSPQELGRCLFEVFLLSIRLKSGIVVLRSVACIDSYASSSLVGLKKPELIHQMALSVS